MTELLGYYEWLEANLETFFKSVKTPYSPGIIVAHGDKVRQYQNKLDQHGIHLYHGAAIYLLSYCNPFDAEVRETKQGWVNPCDWIVNNYFRFQPYLPKIEFALK